MPRGRRRRCRIRRHRPEGARRPAPGHHARLSPRAGNEVDSVARPIVKALEDRGIAAINPSMGFPMEMERFPGKIWVVSHKPVAIAAGLGRMGIHRNVIHPRFGDFILLGTVVIAADISEEGRPVDHNPCLECKLCVAA